MSHNFLYGELYNAISIFCNSFQCFGTELVFIILTLALNNRRFSFHSDAVRPNRDCGAPDRVGGRKLRRLSWKLESLHIHTMFIVFLVQVSNRCVASVERSFSRFLYQTGAQLQYYVRICTYFHVKQVGCFNL